MKNLALMGVLMRFNDDSWQWLTFLGHPVYIGLNRGRENLKIGLACELPALQ